MRSAENIINSIFRTNQYDSEEWRKFSSRIKSTRNCCECCNRTGITLNVHHLFYNNDRKLWDYKDDEVIVVCRDCHKALHTEMVKFRTHVFRYLTPRSFAILNGALAVGLTHYAPLKFVRALAEFVSNERLVNNHEKTWGLGIEK